MSKTIRCIVALLLCVSLLACYVPHVFAEENTVDIASLEDFLTFAENCRLDSYSQGQTFRLTVDIDLSGTDFDGIPIFGGVFDGNYHTISGLQIDSAGSAKGLFRYVQSTATVRDLTVKGTVAPTGSRGDVGGIAGSNAGVIENCVFSGQVTGTENVGGIAGINVAGGFVHNCVSQGSVSGKHFAGGIIGSNAGLIEGCTNEADVNITAQQNDVEISDITMDSLLNSESSVAATDIGGIAGYSEGMVLRCTNLATVGYKHMGYNVGGIVGLQTGYIADCENYGAVFGRKEVGGIVGQQEPNVVLHYTTDTVQILKGQIAVLSELVHTAAANAGNNSNKVRNLIYNLETYVQEMEKAIDVLEKGAADPKLEDLQTYIEALMTIRDCISNIQSTMRSLWDAVDKTATDLNRDMDAITEQMTVIENTLNNAEDNLGGKVFDISDEDTAEDLLSKVESCSNFGDVLADLNAGGIVGVVAFENDLDPEEDITVVGDTSLNAVGSFRSVILNCRNSGAVNGKTMRIGGIVGWLSMGLVKACVNTGHLENATADYVGGIAGDAAGFIRNCMVRCSIGGDMYVGGIAGSGSIATDCQSMVSVSGTERIGAIFGLAAEPYTEVTEPIKGNLYLKTATDIGAIDGISFAGMAQGLSLEEFLRLQPEGSIFLNVTITFEADGKQILQVTLPTGSAFKDIPPVPQKDGATGSWASIEELDLDCVLFDLRIRADYISYKSVIQSQLAAASGKPILLLQGDFAEGASVAVSELETPPALQEDMRLIEGWTFSTENCLALQTGRLLLPEKADTENMIIMVRDADGAWSQRMYRVEDSYIVFSLSNGEDAVALVQMPADSVFTAEVLIAAGIGAFAVLVIVLVCVAVTRRKRKRITAAAKSEE